MTDSDDADGLGMPHKNHKIVLETMEGEFAAVVTITDLGAEASPIIVEGVEGAVTGAFGHLVVEHHEFEDE